MLKQKYFLADIFILSAEKQPIKLSWREIVWLQKGTVEESPHGAVFCVPFLVFLRAWYAYDRIGKRGGEYVQAVVRSGFLCGEAGNAATFPRFLYEETPVPL